MEKDEAERQEIAEIAARVRKEQESDPKRAATESFFSGCCYVTTLNATRHCFDWEGLGEEECKKIGQQSNSAWQFVAGGKCGSA